MATSTEIKPWGGSTQNANIRLEITTCAECGTAFGIESHLHSTLRVDGSVFFCPNGHKLHYGQTRLQQLEQALADERREHSRTEHQRQVTKGALTRLSNRVAFGVCPCCHRHFDNVQRHMATCHPDFLKKQGQTGEPADYVSAEALLTTPPEDVMGVYEAAQYKGVTAQTVYYAIRTRKLPAIMVKSRFQVTRKSVEAWNVRGGKRFAP